MREPNAIDFWRGLALVTIFVNHMPGNLFERFHVFAIRDLGRAELFVFLAGWSIGIATKRGAMADPTRRRRSCGSVPHRRGLPRPARDPAIAFAMIAGTALYLDNPLLLEWHDAGTFFGDADPDVVGWVALAYQLGFFNILPLYVVLLVLAPVFVLLARVEPWAALPLSFALYLACLVFEMDHAHLARRGVWYYNPLAWQFLLVLGFRRLRIGSREIGQPSGAGPGG